MLYGNCKLDTCVHFFCRNSNSFTSALYQSKTYNDRISNYGKLYLHQNVYSSFQTKYKQKLFVWALAKYYFGNSSTRFDEISLGRSWRFCHCMFYIDTTQMWWNLNFYKKKNVEIKNNNILSLHVPILPYFAFLCRKYMAFYI